MKNIFLKTSRLIVSKAFWNYVQSKTKTRESVGNLIDDRGEIVTEGIKKATILNEFFTSVFIKENTSEMPLFNSRCEGVSIDNFEITAEMVEKYLKRLNASKSQGPDNLHPKLLLETLDEIKEPLTEIFKKSLQEGTVPNDWKLANIVLLHKKGSKSSPENYRPISLTSVVSKIMESLLGTILWSIWKKTKFYQTPAWFQKRLLMCNTTYRCLRQMIRRIR